jgi:hypothetical protein
MGWETGNWISPAGNPTSAKMTPTAPDERNPSFSRELGQCIEQPQISRMARIFQPPDAMPARRLSLADLIRDIRAIRGSSC